MAITCAVENLHPSAGVRIALELETEDRASAHYRAAIYTPASRFDYRLAIAMSDGLVTLIETPAEKNAPFSDLVCAMARSLYRDALAASPVRWPRRLLRWRDK